MNNHCWLGGGFRTLLKTMDFHLTYFEFRIPAAGCGEGTALLLSYVDHYCFLQKFQKTLTEQQFFIYK